MTIEIAATESVATLPLLCEMQQIDVLRREAEEFGVADEVRDVMNNATEGAIRLFTQLEAAHGSDSDAFDAALQTVMDQRDDSSPATLREIATRALLGKKAAKIIESGLDAAVLQQRLIDALRLVHQNEGRFSDLASLLHSLPKPERVSDAEWVELKLQVFAGVAERRENAMKRVHADELGYGSGEQNDYPLDRAFID